MMEDNTICLDSPTFWINLKDPRQTSTEPLNNKDEWTPVQMGYCAPDYLKEQAMLGNMVYILKDKKSATMGYVLKIESELFNHEGWKKVVKDSRFSPGQYQLRKQDLIHRINLIENGMKILDELKMEAKMSYEEWLEHKDGLK